MLLLGILLKTKRRCDMRKKRVGVVIVIIAGFFMSYFFVVHANADTVAQLRTDLKTVEGKVAEIYRYVGFVKKNIGWILGALGLSVWGAIKLIGVYVKRRFEKEIDKAIYKVDPTYVDCGTTATAAQWKDANGCTYICKSKPSCTAAAGVIFVDCATIATAPAWVGADGCNYACKGAACTDKKAITYLDCGITTTAVSWTDPTTGCKFACKAAPTCPTKTPIVKTACDAEYAGSTYVDPKDGCTYICPQKADCSLFDRVCPAGQSLVNDPANPANCICSATATSICPPALKVTAITIGSTVATNVRATGTATISNGQAAASGTASSSNVASALVTGPQCPQPALVCPPGQELVSTPSPDPTVPCPSYSCKPKCVGASQPTTASYSIDGQGINSFAVPALAAGASYTGTITFVCLRDGAHTLTVSVASSGAADAGASKSVQITCLPSSKGVQSAAASSSITSSMADLNGDTYLKVMNTLGVYLPDYRK